MLVGDDDAENIAEIRRHSPHDADAYERYHHDLDRVMPGGPAAVRQPAARHLRQGPRGPGRHQVAARPPRRRSSRRSCTTPSGCSPAASSDWLDDYFENDAVKGLRVLVRSSAPRSGRCRRARGWCCCSTRWASTTARSAGGRSTRAATAASRRCWRGPPSRSAPRSGSTRRCRPCSSRRARRSASRSRTAPSSTPRSWSRRSTPRRTFLELVSPRELPAELVDNIERMRFQGVSAKVNFALDGLPVFPALPDRSTSTAASSTSAPRSSTSSGRSTPRSTAGTASGPSSTARSSPSSTPTWRRRASTSCPASSSTRRTTSRAATGTPSAQPSVTRCRPCSSRTSPGSATSCCTARW